MNGVPRSIWILLSIGALASLLAGERLWGDRMGPIPPDAVLTERFREHASDLDTLAAAALADTALVGAAYDPILLRFSVYVRHTPRADRLLSDAEVRSTGRSAYRRLLDRAGLRGLQRGHDGASVRFQVRSAGGVRKGIVYSTKPLAPVRPSLDGLEREVRRTWTPAFAALTPGWYLFLEPRPE